MVSAKNITNITLLHYKFSNFCLLAAGAEEKFFTYIYNYNYIYR